MQGGFVEGNDNGVEIPGGFKFESEVRVFSLNGCNYVVCGREGIVGGDKEGWEFRRSERRSSGSV